MGTTQAKPQAIHGSQVELADATRKNDHAIAEQSQPSQTGSEEVVPYVMHVSVPFFLVLTCLNDSADNFQGLVSLP